MFSVGEKCLCTRDSEYHSHMCVCGYVSACANTHTHTLFVECFYGVLKDHVIFTDDLMVPLTMRSATLIADLLKERCGSQNLSYFAP